MRKPRAYAALAGLVVIAAIALVMGHGLGEPPTYVHDECYQAFTAGRYLRADRAAWDPAATRSSALRLGLADMSRFSAYDWVHPPGAKLIMAGFMALFGTRASSYRLGSLLFGVLTLSMTWLLAWRMRGPAFALVTVALLACDGMVFVMSRVAMNDIYVTGCLVTASYLLYRFFEDAAHRSRDLIAAGAAFGAAAVMKWSAIPLLVSAASAVAGWMMWTARSRGRADPPSPWSARRWCLAFVAAPACVYLAAYVPYFLLGHGWRDFLALQRAMWGYHQSLEATHLFASPWWQWPWVTQPVLLYERVDESGLRILFLMGNPILWWMMVPSLIWVAARMVRRRDPRDAMILVGVGALWLPWAFVRRVAFIQYLLPVLPFGAIAVASVLDDLACSWRRAGRAIGLVYIAACLGTFVCFHPIWSAALVRPAQVESARWLWLASWRRTLKAADGLPQ